MDRDKLEDNVGYAFMGELPETGPTRALLQRYAINYTRYQELQKQLQEAREAMQKEDEAVAEAIKSYGPQVLTLLDGTRIVMWVDKGEFEEDVPPEPAVMISVIDKMHEVNP